MEPKATAQELLDYIEARYIGQQNCLVDAKELITVLRAYLTASHSGETGWRDIALLADLAEGFVPLCDANSKLETVIKRVRAIIPAQEPKP